MVVADSFSKATTEQEPGDTVAPQSCCCGQGTLSDECPSKNGEWRAKEASQNTPHSALEMVEEIPSIGAGNNRTTITYIISAGEATVTLQGVLNLLAAQSPDLPLAGGVPPSHLLPS